MATSATDDFVFGTRDNATPGTELQVDVGSYTLQSILLIAHSDNVGRIFYGASDVTSSTQKGLLPGESVTITGKRPFLITTIYFDAGTAGDGIDFVGVRSSR